MGGTYDNVIDLRFSCRWETHVTTCNVLKLTVLARINTYTQSVIVTLKQRKILRCNADISVGH